MLQEKFCNLYFENVLHKALDQMYKKMHLSTWNISMEMFQEG